MQKPWLPLVAAIVVALYGGILRAHVLSGRYGIVTHPAWAHAITAAAPPIARALEPKIYAWPPVANPYVGGDPVNYLRFAREMESFYRGTSANRCSRPSFGCFFGRSGTRISPSALRPRQCPPSACSQSISSGRERSVRQSACSDRWASRSTTRR